MDNLFNWMIENKDNVNPLILSSVFHYEFVFIHPFSDGNGRTARLWQTVILSHFEKAFTYLPIESMIKKNQDEYYKIIDECNKDGNSTKFIEFMLKMIKNTIYEIAKSTTQEITQETTQEKILNLIKTKPSITQIEMSEALGLTRDGISYNIKKLKDSGIIERVGSTKNGIWKIKRKK